MAEDGAEAPAPSVVAPAVVPSPAGAWPDFAVVCSFLERYGAALDLPELTFPELEEALEESGAVSKALVELHLKLMRKIGKSVTLDRWEKYLIKICQDYNSTWAWEMEKKGYQEMSVECKVGLLKHLCECQFDDNLKFKNAINEEDADAMRLQPLGRDKDGLMYWYQLDQEHNIRMYIEEQDDQDGSTWKCIVRTRNELAETLELLKAQIDPALLKKSEPPESSSRESPNPEDENIKKEENEEKPADDLDQAGIKEKANALEKPTSPCPAENGGSFKTDGEKPLKTCSEIKTEPASDVKEETQTAKEESDCFKENIKPVIVENKDEKAEPKDLKESTGNSDKTLPPQEPERSEISVIVKRTEEHVEKSVEDTGKMKNDQQAKIPLKKRELKLTEDFDSQVKTSLCKSKTPTKELLQKEEGKQDDGTKTSVGTCTAAEGKQLVNGDLTCDKSHKVQDHAEISSIPTRESVIGSTKNESRITNERNPSVIKSLQEVKENGKKSLMALSSDPITPLLEEPPQKASVKIVPCEAGLEKSSAEAKVGEAKKEKSVSDCDKEKQIQIKGDASSSDSVDKPKVLDKPVKVSPTVDNVKEGTGKPEEPVSETLCNDDELGTDRRKEEPESKRKDRKAKRNATTRRRFPISKRTSMKNSTLKPEKSSENKEKEGNEVRKEPEVPNDKVEENEKNAEDTAVLVKKSFTLRSKRKEKSSVKEGDAAEPLDSKGAEKDKVDGTASAEQEKTSEKPSLVSKNKHKLKPVPEDENSGPESKEMTSERQKDGIKLTIRISSKRRRPELPVENIAVEDADDAETEENIGRRLRRSPRISRPSAKVTEVKEQKPEKKESDEEELPEPPKVEKARKAEREPSQKIKKKPRQRRRARWTNSRSRRRRKSSSEEETEESDSEDDSEEGSENEEKVDGVPGEDDEPCKKCGLPNHPELILLCDSCDSGYHTACLRPPLMIIPDGEWFCPPCQHKLLCEKLEEQLQNLDVVLKKKERAERRKERLVYVGISIENIIPTQETEEVPEVQVKEEKKKKKPKPLERRSTRARKFISYRFDEFDEAIDEAIEDDIRDADGGGGGGRGKDMANITGNRGKDISTILEGEKPEGKRPQRAVTRRKKRRRLNDLDSDSNVDEEESEDEFQISEGSQDEFVVSEENPDESDDQQSNDSDFGTRRPRRHYRRPMRQSRRLKRRSVRRRYSDDDDEDESEEDEQATETEASSDYSDDYLDTRRRRSRRNQKRQVNYKEDSESDGSQKGARRGRGKEMRRVLKRRFSSSESNESDSNVEKPLNARKSLLRKRIRSSDDDLSEEEEKPVRKRLNRIETDDEEEGDSKVSSSKKTPTEDKPPASTTIPEGTKKPCYRIESDDDDFETVTKDGSPLDYSLVDLPSTNGQSPEKTIETLIGKPSEKSQTSKDASAAVSQASNGTGSSQEAVVPEEDEDELLRVTDLVDYVCNSEQL
ncbi:remodeling and spacing factor 1 isoform X2 [Pseudophryne corroboree]|uniref:remodeling and spacing factor 1 isoform X2 n=1 Tax=Pseudophryne corroboree TaxID=495146 RepID=UPI0030813AE7